MIRPSTRSNPTKIDPERQPSTEERNALLDGALRTEKEIKTMTRKQNEIARCAARCAEIERLHPDYETCPGELIEEHDALCKRLAQIRPNPFVMMMMGARR